MPARESRDAAHALALTLESQRVQVVALAQALERAWAGNAGSWIRAMGELAAQLSEGDAPVQALEAERQAALVGTRAHRSRDWPKRVAAGGHRQRPAPARTGAPAARCAESLEQREAISQRRLDLQAWR